MNELNQTFESALFSLAPGGTSFLLAVSGGMDSICLLDLFCSCPNRSDYRLGIAYINHNLRHEESAAEEKLVFQTAAAYDVPCYSKSVAPEEWKKRDGLSIEMKARRIRYDFFKTLCKEHSFDYLVTAHNFNDKIETLFLQLFRAGGPETLVSIPARADMHGYTIIRPLLQTGRKQICSYVKEKKLSYIEDSTNKEDFYKRNIIRNRLFPHFPAIHRDYEKSFNHLFSYLDEQESFLKEQTRSAFADVLAVSHAEAVALHLERFRKLHPFMKKSVVKACLHYLGYPVKPNKDMLEAACSNNRICYSKKGFTMETKKRCLWLVKAPSESGGRMYRVTPGEKSLTVAVNEYRVVLEKTADFDLTNDFVISAADFGDSRELKVRPVRADDVVKSGGKEKKIFSIAREAGFPEAVFRFLYALVRNDTICAFFCFDYFRVAPEWYVKRGEKEAVKIAVLPLSTAT